MSFRSIRAPAWYETPFVSAAIACGIVRQGSVWAKT
jgi:hypothetical protein